MVPFEDILDGYFPLRVSVTDLMQRRQLSHAKLEMIFAPIIEVEGLPDDAPVPLNIRSGRAGMIRAAELSVTMAEDGAEMHGQAQWSWLDQTPTAACLDPMMRLAEPALVHVTPQIAAPLDGQGGIRTSILEA